MSSILLKDGLIVNEGKQFFGSVLIQDERISEIFSEKIPETFTLSNVEIISCEGKIIMPGIIDDHVHFREPGLTQKATIATESRAALAGGVTSFMDMPNVVPQTTTIENLEQKLAIASETSFANYSFYFGATNSNIDQIRALDYSAICAIKVFMGSSTGNMLIDDDQMLRNLFSEVKIPIAIHSEDENIIKTNLAHYIDKFGDNIPFSYHPKIRNIEACYKSTQKAVNLSKQCGTRLHILHISTAQELQLLESGNVGDKQITSETCPHYLWFTDADYDTKGALVKCNPAIKSENDRTLLRQAVAEGKIDVVATDHAPHLISEKLRPYTKSSSGMPFVQHSLLVMLELYKQKQVSLSQIVKSMCHNPADLFGIQNRGYIRKNYFADLVIVNPNETTTINKDNILYKCQWSPLEGQTFSSHIEKTFLNGYCVYNNGKISEKRQAQQLVFSH